MKQCFSKIIVKGCKLEYWEHAEGDRWQCLMTCFCGHGRNGYTSFKKEGDGCTPVGIFPLEIAFGTEEDPGAALPYRKIGPDSYWSGERKDYNRWVEVPSGSRDMSRSERLADYPVQYRYAMSVGYNTNSPEWGKGSAIFFHCKGPAGWPTAGCISVDAPIARMLLQRCAPGSIIQILG